MKSSLHMALFWRAKTSRAALRQPRQLVLPESRPAFQSSPRSAQEHRSRPALDRADFPRQLDLGHVMASLAGVVDIQHRASHPVAADLHCALALVGHVAIGAGNPALRVDALAPEFKLGVLRFVNERPRFAMLKIVERSAVREFVIVVLLFDLLSFQSIPPGEKSRSLLAQ